jgi:oligosaccharide repeat unit polymerase
MSPANPVLVYSAVWLVVLGLTAMGLTTQLLPLNPGTITLVLANIATFIGAFGAVSWLCRRVPLAAGTGASSFEFAMLRRLCVRLLQIWAAGSIIEIIIGGGLPILWLLAGDTTRDYRDFGIPSVHGFLTAIYLTLVVAHTLFYRVQRDRRDLVMVLFLLWWPLLQVNRGAFIWALLEIAAVQMITSRFVASQLLKAGAVALAALLLFGFVGDLRAGFHKEGLREVVSPNAKFLVDDLPSGFLWVYIYVTSPVNNVIAAIDRLQPTHRVYFSAMNLLPTVVRDKVFTDPNNRYALGLVNEAFNTATWYANFLADFGVRGAIVLVAGLQLVIAWFYVYARRGWVWAILAYAALFQALALSIFADTLTSLVTVAQVLIAVGFGQWTFYALQQAHRPRPATERG